MQFVNFFGVIMRCTFIASIFGIVHSTLRTPSGKTVFRKLTTMSVTNGVIIGGGRIGSFMHESNGKSLCIEIITEDLVVFL